MTMPGRILIVEDDATLAGLMASVLSDAGYESDVVPSPDRARGIYDLVVADYLAPTYAPGQPWPFLSQLRALSKDGRILGCTGHQDALADPPAKLGVAAVTPKPFDVDTLVRKVDELIAQGHSVVRTSPMLAHSALA
jgi:DNA-binding response OmpR family regulator